MNEPRVFFVHLRRPRRSDDQRDDPFYEEGSFGCTECHSTNLLHPRHAKELKGARLGFIQGGPCGSRLVFLTPPIRDVQIWKNLSGKRFCEVKWTKGVMPFKYSKAPILVWKHHRSDFPSIKKLARAANCPSLESGLSSLFRSRTQQLPPKEAKEVVKVYEQHPKARSTIASKYDETVPDVRQIDEDRAGTYRAFLAGLRTETDSAESDIDERAITRKAQAHCVRRTSRCRK